MAIEKDRIRRTWSLDLFNATPHTLNYTGLILSGVVRGVVPSRIASGETGRVVVEYEGDEPVGMTLAYIDYDLPPEWGELRCANRWEGSFLRRPREGEQFIVVRDSRLIGSCLRRTETELGSNEAWRIEVARGVTPPQEPIHVEPLQDFPPRR